MTIEKGVATNVRISEGILFCQNQVTKEKNIVKKNKKLTDRANFLEKSVLVFFNQTTSFTKNRN
jgi:hypothetical protein